MDPVSATSSTSSTSSPRAATTEEKPSAAASLTADFNNFLTLLTTQLKAQDPLSPVESTQFVEQLASFSSVEQQIQTNTKLDAIANSLGRGDLESAALWIGKSVETRANDVRFAGSPIEFAAPGAEAYDALTATIKDEGGTVIAQLPLDKTDTTHVWRGEDGKGGRVLNGDYSIELEYRRGGSVVRTEVAPQFGVVDEARLTADGWRLKLSSGSFIDTADVTAIMNRTDEPRAAAN